MNLRQIENAGEFNCLLSCLATLAKYYERDYQMIFSSNWKLRYNSNAVDKRIGEKIDIVSETDIVSRSIKFHGFSWKMYPFKFPDDYENIVEPIYPILATVDLYNFKFSDYFNKYHFIHSFIINEYDFKKKEYLCVDPYFQYAQYVVPKRDLMICLKQWGEIEFYNLPKDICVSEYIKAINEDVSEVNNDNYNNIKSLARDIYNEMNIAFEFGEFQEYIQKVPIMNSIRKVAMYRSAYSSLLDYVYELYKIENFRVASILLKQSVVLWKTVKGKLLKAYLTHSINREKITIFKLVNKIADTEHLVTELILLVK